MLCAWCSEHGNPDIGLRAAHTRKWEGISEDYAQALSRAGFASHGVCPDCRDALAAECGAPSSGPAGADPTAET